MSLDNRMALLPRLFTVDTAATQLDCHPETLRRAIRRGDLACYRIGGCTRIAPDQLTAYLEASLCPARDPGLSPLVPVSFPVHRVAMSSSTHTLRPVLPPRPGSSRSWWKTRLTVPNRPRPSPQSLTLGHVSRLLKG